MVKDDSVTENGNRKNQETAKNYYGEASWQQLTIQLPDVAKKEVKDISFQRHLLLQKDKNPGMKKKAFRYTQQSNVM